MTEEAVKQFLLTVVNALVTKKDEVNVKKDGCFINFNLKVVSDNTERVIGKNGSVIQAIRTIVYGIRIDDSLRIKLNIID